MDSEEVLPVLQDERSVMNFLVRPAAVLTRQFFLSYDDCGDDLFSPVMGGRVPLNCHVDLESLWMLPWDDRRNVETGSRAGVWDWMSILCNVAQLSRMLEFPDTDCLNCFLNVGKICMLDYNVRGMYPRVDRLGAVWRWLLDCRLFRITGCLSDTVAQRRGCTRMRNCTGNGHSPGETQDAREAGVSPGEMKCAEDSAYIKPDSVVESPVYVWSVTGSLLVYEAYSSCPCLLRTRRGLCLLASGSTVVSYGGL